jgi:hypothetical protein
VSSIAAAPDAGNPVSFFWSDDAIRSRSVSGTVLCSTLDLPATPAWLAADWDRDIHVRLGLEPGDVESLSLARTRRRWPGYTACVEALHRWMGDLGLQDVLASSDVALMACRGAQYHHDALQYGSSAFCNLFLSDDRGLDLHFCAAGLRIPLVRGTAVIFDTGQPHAVISRSSSVFDPSDFSAGQDCNQVFLSWELPIENPHVAQALGVVFDVAGPSALLPQEPQIRVHGAPASLCPYTGQWSST